MIDKLSRHITIAAALSTGVGTSAILTMLFSLFQGETAIDLTVFGIFSGYGLLKGDESSRRCILIFAKMGIFLMVILSPNLLYSFFNDQGGSSPDFYLITRFLILFVCCIYMVIALNLKHNGQPVHPIKLDRNISKALVWATVLVSALLVTDQKLSELSVVQTNKEMYPVKVKIIPMDQVTGNSISTLQCDYVFTGDELNPDYGFRQISINYGNGPQDSYITLSGIAISPMAVTIKAPGFKDQTTVIDGRSPLIEYVKMTPITDKLDSTGQQL